MKKVVISGSSKLKKEVNHWINRFKKKGFEILDYPKPVESKDYSKELPKIYKNYYTALENTDIYFLMNEERKGIKGYVGASATAELTYVVIQNLLHNKNIYIYILNEPSKDVLAYDEIMFWLDMGWIKLYDENEL